MAAREELCGITPSILHIIKTIKQIQERKRDPAISKLEFTEMYSILSEEFSDFADQYTTIFSTVIRGERLDMVARSLYYKDQLLRGLITEEEIADKIAATVIPLNLRTDVDDALSRIKQYINPTTQSTTTV